MVGISLENFDEIEAPSLLFIRTPFSAVLREDDDEVTQFSSVDDEQIVNIALILLLQRFCLLASDVKKIE